MLFDRTIKTVDLERMNDFLTRIIALSDSIITLEEDRLKELASMEESIQMRRLTSDAAPMFQRMTQKEFTCYFLQEKAKVVASILRENPELKRVMDEIQDYMNLHPSECEAAFFKNTRKGLSIAQFYGNYLRAIKKQKEIQNKLTAYKRI